MSTETTESEKKDTSRFFKFDVEIIDKERKDHDKSATIKWSFNYKFALNEFSYILNS